MFPSFIRTKVKLLIRFERELKRRIREHPRMPDIGEQIIHEGSYLVTTSIDGYEDKDPITEHQAGFVISDEEMREKGPQAIFDKIPTLAEDMVVQRTKALFEKMEDVTNRTGNIVDGEGKALSPELLMKTLEKTEINFDEFGNLIMPTFFIPPKILKKMGENVDIWKETPESREKMTRIIEKKRSEWIDRQNRRKLVD